MKKSLSLAVALVFTSPAFANNAVDPAQASEILAQQAAQLNNGGVNNQTINQLLQTANQAQQQLGQAPIGNGIASGANNTVPVNYFNGVQPKLSPKEIKGVATANSWIKRTDMPTHGNEGAVVFAYGASLPTIVCAPLYACTLKLQPGEVIQQIDIADNVRWNVAPSVVGSGDNQTSVIIIKPKDSNLETNMTISTDRRLYVVKLLSRLKDWMPLAAFSYPEDTQAAWEKYNQQVKSYNANNIMSNGQNISNLDFNFKISGNNTPWKPLRVYTDGSKTYIQFSENVTRTNDNLPVLLAIGSDKKEQLINYRLVGDRFVVDNVIDHAMLISGVGRKQARVDIKRK